MSKRNKLIAIIAAAAVALVVILMLVMGGSGEEAAASASQSESEASSVSRPESEASSAASEEADSEPETGMVPAVTAAPAATAAPAVAPQEARPAEPEYVSLPYAVPDSPLVIEALNSYDGIYLEDGSDAEISGVASLIVKNTGDRCVEYAKIAMDGLTTDFTFELSGLEAGATMVVLEAGKSPAAEQQYNSITSDTALLDRFEMSEGVLLVEEAEEGKLRVTNKSEQDIPCARVFYKFHMAEEDVYVGGITYVVKVEDLKAGASAEVAPSHYVPGSSRVIMARTYATAEE